MSLDDCAREQAKMGAGIRGEILPEENSGLWGGEGWKRGAEDWLMEETLIRHEILKAPFPYFGGKSRVAHLVWDRFGNVDNYVEPFAGSLAVLLSRPSAPQTETVNDIDCFLANFWRAVSFDPQGVAEHADWPVNEADLHARHLWLINREEFREAMKTDPEFYDIRIAGWWVWGISQWIGSGWCARPEWSGRINAGGSARGINTEQYAVRPALGTEGVGVHRKLPSLRNTGMGINRKRPMIHGGHTGKGVHAAEPGALGIGVNRKLPAVGSDGRGIERQDILKMREAPPLGEDGSARVWAKRPDLGTAEGRGVNRQRPELSHDRGIHSERVSRQIPHLRNPGRGIHRRIPCMGEPQGLEADRVTEFEPGEKRPFLSGHGSGVGVHSERSIADPYAGLYAYFDALCARLRRVRVCCGDWKRVTGPSVTVKHGVCGVFLDPPYDMRLISPDAQGLYSTHSNDLSAEVRAWAIENGSNPLLRIALCGYDTEHGDQMPPDWECVHWKAQGGYGSQNAKGNENSGRERIWFSPHCLRQPTLFDF